jgi:hypothetical protein
LALNIVQVEEINALLQEVPRLVDRLENRSSDFWDGVHTWLKHAENILENNRLPTVSQVAAYRAMLLQATRGAQSGDITIAGKPTPRKIRDATATLVLQRCNQLLHDLIAERQTVFQEADRLARQLIAVAEVNGMIQRCKNNSPHQAFLQCVQKSIEADPNLLGVYTHLVALVGKVDVLIFLDRAIVD